MKAQALQKLVIPIDILKHVHGQRVREKVMIT
jgi:hypothetical protein